MISRRGWRLGYQHVSPSVFGSTGTQGVNQPRKHKSDPKPIRAQAAVTPSLGRHTCSTHQVWTDEVPCCPRANSGIFSSSSIRQLSRAPASGGNVIQSCPRSPGSHEDMALRLLSPQADSPSPGSRELQPQLMPWLLHSKSLLCWQSL